MAEQEKKQEAKVERPQVRKVRLAVGVFLDQSREEIDLEGGWAKANQASVEVHPGKGVIVRRTSPKPGAEKLATWIPESMIKQIDVSPEWKP